MTPLKGNAKSREILQMEKLLAKLKRKQGIYERAKKRGEEGAPLTPEEQDQLQEILKKTIAKFHPRS